MYCSAHSLTHSGKIYANLRVGSLDGNGAAPRASGRPTLGCGPKCEVASLSPSLRITFGAECELEQAHCDVRLAQLLSEERLRLLRRSSFNTCLLPLSPSLYLPFSHALFFSARFLQLLSYHELLRGLRVEDGVLGSWPWSHRVHNLDQGWTLRPLRESGAAAAVNIGNVERPFRRRRHLAILKGAPLARGLIVIGWGNGLEGFECHAREGAVSGGGALTALKEQFCTSCE